MAQSKKNQAQFFKERLAQVNKVLNKFEGEVEKAVLKFKKQGEKSSKVIRKNFDEILEIISSNEIYSKANEKREELTKEVTRIADDIVQKVKKFDFKKANAVLEEVRSNVDAVLEKLQSSDLIEKALKQAKKSRIQVMNVLRIPTQEEVTQLSKKVVDLEKKLKTIQKAA